MPPVEIRYWVCRYENVPYQREVTKYRSETRTRTVTKYRDEQRCCRDEQRSVFDRQLQFQVEVRFPADTELTGEQLEVLNIILASADANTARVELQVLNSVYNYRIANQEVSGATIRVDLEATQKTTLSQGDLASLTDYKKLVISLAGAGLDSALLTQDEQVKAAGGHVRMADVIQNAGAIRSALVAGNTIVYSVIAKRTGTSSLLAGKTLKAQKLDSVLLK